jgi:hypothetical protein
MEKILFQTIGFWCSLLDTGEAQQFSQHFQLGT